MRENFYGNSIFGSSYRILFPGFDQLAGPLLTLWLLILFLLQFRLPLRVWFWPKFRHAFANAAVSLPSFIVLRLAVFPAGYATAVWAKNEHFGLSYFMSMPRMMEYILIFLAMDLSFYYWHILNHKISFFWRFHNVHHIDLDLDVSTAIRFHFGELLFSIGFRALQVLLLGVPTTLFFVYESIFQAATEFHHSNLRFPISLERQLILVIVTPRMHGIHHSIVQQETDSNFSTIFSFWDRLHRTIRLNIPQDKITIGVPAYQDASYHKISNLLFLPFQRQKQYWIADDGSIPMRKDQEGFNRAFLSA